MILYLGRNSKMQKYKLEKTNIINSASDKITELKRSQLNMSWQHHAITEKTSIILGCTDGIIESLIK